MASLELASSPEKYLKRQEEPKEGMAPLFDLDEFHKPTVLHTVEKRSYTLADPAVFPPQYGQFLNDAIQVVKQAILRIHDCTTMEEMREQHALAIERLRQQRIPEDYIINHYDYGKYALALLAGLKGELHYKKYDLNNGENGKRLLPSLRTPTTFHAATDYTESILSADERGDVFDPFDMENNKKPGQITAPYSSLPELLTSKLQAIEQVLEERFPDRKETLPFRPLGKTYSESPVKIVQLLDEKNLPPDLPLTEFLHGFSFPLSLISSYVGHLEITVALENNGMQGVGGDPFSGPAYYWPHLTITAKISEEKPSAIPPRRTFSQEIVAELGKLVTKCYDVNFTEKSSTRLIPSISVPRTEAES